MKTLKLGKYKHSKSGKLYEVIGLGRHSETLEEFIIYKALYDSKKFGNKSIWVRPIEMFLEKVEINNKKIPRFQFIK